MYTLICCLLALLAASSAAAATNNHVLLITIDGLAASYLPDPQASLPTLRGLAGNGARAEAVHVSNPTITWPNHTTLVTGVTPAKHSVLFNGLLVRPGPGLPVRIDGRRDQSELVAVPTVFDLLSRAGYRTAAINWPCTRNSTTLDDNFPDVLEQMSYITPPLRDGLLAAGILKNTNNLGFRLLSAAERDRVWTDSAAYVLRTTRPNLVLVHLLLTDSTQHRHGPQSPEAYAAVAEADAHVAELLVALDSAGIRNTTTVFVTSDHGFARVSKFVNPNVIFRRAGLIRPGSRTRVQAFAEGGIAFVYLTDPGTRETDRTKALDLLRDQEGIASILGLDKFAALGLPDPAKNAQMADLLLLAADGYAFQDEVFAESDLVQTGHTSGSHGYPASSPAMNGILIASGRGIKQGFKLGAVSNLDIAPTIAALLGQKMPDLDGHVLSEIFEP